MEYIHSQVAHNYVSWSTCIVYKLTYSQIFEPLTKIKAYHLNTTVLLNLGGITRVHIDKHLVIEMSHLVDLLLIIEYTPKTCSSDPLDGH